MRGDRRRDRTLNNRCVDDDNSPAEIFVEKIERRFRGQYRRTEITQDDDAPAVIRSGDGVRHSLKARADTSLVCATRRDDPHAFRHLTGQFDDAVRDLRTVGHDDEPYGHAAAAVRAAALSKSALDWAPGSRCPIARSPR